MSISNEQGLTAEITAARLGITVRHLTRLVAEGLPTVGAGRKRRYEWRSVFEWYQGRLARQIAGPAGSELVMQQIRKLKAEADRIELKLSKEKGELVARAEVLAAMTTTAHNIRNRFLSLPSRLAPILCGETSRGVVYTILDDHIRDVLTLLSEHAADPDLPTEDELPSTNTPI